MKKWCILSLISLGLIANQSFSQTIVFSKYSPNHVLVENKNPHAMTVFVGKRSVTVSGNSSAPVRCRMTKRKLSKPVKAEYNLAAYYRDISIVKYEFQQRERARQQEAIFRGIFNTLLGGNQGGNILNALDVYWNRNNPEELLRQSKKLEQLEKSNSALESKMIELGYAMQQYYRTGNYPDLEYRNEAALTRLKAHPSDVFYPINTIKKSENTYFELQVNYAPGYTFSYNGMDSLNRVGSKDRYQVSLKGVLNLRRDYNSSRGVFQYVFPMEVTQTLVHHRLNAKGDLSPQGGRTWDLVSVGAGICKYPDAYFIRSSYGFFATISARTGRVYNVAIEKDSLSNQSVVKSIKEDPKKSFRSISPVLGLGCSIYFNRQLSLVSSLNIPLGGKSIINDLPQYFHFNLGLSYVLFRTKGY